MGSKYFNESFNLGKKIMLVFLIWKSVVVGMNQFYGFSLRGSIPNACIIRKKIPVLS